MESLLKIRKGGGCLKPHLLEESVKLNWNFQRSRKGVINQKKIGELWINIILFPGKKCVKNIYNYSNSSPFLVFTFQALTNLHISITEIT